MTDPGWRQIRDAAGGFGDLVRETPCRRSEYLSGLVGGDVFLKLENQQTTGSFKIRGVANAVRSLPEADRCRPMVAASTGNHGAAFAFAVRRFHLDGRLFMPRTATASKVEKLRSAGLPLELVGEDCVEAEAAGAEWAAEHGGVWISPYNDPRVVAGQGTIAVEMVRQLGSFDHVLVPVGGGGLVSGIAIYLDGSGHGAEVIGCQPASSCVMARSIAAGHIVDDEGRPTISDATAGGIEAGSLTFDVCRRLVNDIVVVDEEEIVAAIRLLCEQEEVAVEGAAALTVAALLRSPQHFAGRRSVLILSGGNIDQATLQRVGCDPAVAMRWEDTR